MIFSINKILKQDKRLSTLIAEIEGNILIDIGCDHGYVTVGALLNGKVGKVLAVDISAASLAKTVTLAKECGLSDSITPICADGFAPIEPNVDVAVISGIGGYEIVDILRRAPRIPDRIVLCPHQNAYELRKYLSGNFKIEKDYTIASGGKYYPVIVLGKGNDEYTVNELRFGKNSPPSDDYTTMLAARKRVLDERFLNHNVPEGKLRDEYKEVTELCLKLKI